MIDQLNITNLSVCSLRPVQRPSWKHRLPFRHRTMLSILLAGDVPQDFVTEPFGDTPKAVRIACTLQRAGHGALHRARPSLAFWGERAEGLSRLGRQNHGGLA